MVADIMQLQIFSPQQGNISKVKELLDGGANWSICDTKKHQPCLFHAYIHDHKEVGMIYTQTQHCGQCICMDYIVLLFIIV